MTAFIIILLLGVLISGFIVLAPQFGKPPHGEHLEVLKKSRQYFESRFENNPKIHITMSFTETISFFYELIRGGEGRQPHQKLPSHTLVTSEEDRPYLTWFGHSTFFYEVGQKKILFDPMLGTYASPVPGIVKRYDYDLPTQAEEIPHLDIVIISHDHYDHLDYGTVKTLIPKTKRFIVPLGVGSHLQRWGVPEEKITELDWWEDVVVDGVTITAVPSQHFSGRSLTDNQKTLWAAWIIKNKDANVFFGGDSGYFPGFKSIGDTFGPFDITLLDSGQYHDYWSEAHMTPEESVVAHNDLQGNMYMPIHWSAFTLALHDWTDPVERALEATKKHEIEMVTPMIGERFNILTERPNKKWWRDLTQEEIAESNPF